MDQEYTIFQSQKYYVFPAFVTEPADCPVTYTFTVTDAAGEKVVTLNSDLRKFYFGQNEDMSLAGDLFTDYTVTIAAIAGSPTAGTVNSIPTTASFNLRVKNPCLNPEFVQIIPSDLLYVTYTLGSFADTQPIGLQWEICLLYTSPSPRDA